MESSAAVGADGVPTKIGDCNGAYVVFIGFPLASLVAFVAESAEVA